MDHFCPACAREFRRDANLQRARATTNRFDCLDCGTAIDVSVLQVDAAGGDARRRLRGEGLMVDLEPHSDYLTEAQAQALELALTRMGFGIGQIGRMVNAACQLPAQSPSDLKKRKRSRR
ncbi:hypothetical protein [Nocardia sp. NPDC049149]|uniref:hypothetical protein n=1 Tax=Nocardia sp. NPDC049149 TaxID=3364315 RepID=UPI00371E4031